MIILCLGMKERSRRHMEEGLEAWRSSEGARIKMEAQTKLSSSLPRSPGTVSTKMVTQVTYGPGFGCSWYVWKANVKTFPMVFVGGPNSSESLGIVRASWCSESVLALRRRILVFGPCIELEPIRVVSRGSYMTLVSLNQSLPLSLGFRFCLDYSVDKSFAAAIGLWDPNFVRLIIHLQFSCIPLCSCVCSWFIGKDLAFLVRSTMQRRSITKGVVVLWLWGSEPICSEARSNCVVTPPNRELSKPFKRSGNLVHINSKLDASHGRWWCTA
jgi:hypothetical protein